jgi:hypothetical protein
MVPSMMATILEAPTPCLTRRRIFHSFARNKQLRYLKLVSIPVSVLFTSFVGDIVRHFVHKENGNIIQTKIEIKK